MKVDLNNIHLISELPTKPGLYASTVNFPTGAYELYLTRQGTDANGSPVTEMFLSGWIKLESFNSDEQRDTFLQNWMTKVGVQF